MTDWCFGMMWMDIFTTTFLDVLSVGVKMRRWRVAPQPIQFIKIRIAIPNITISAENKDVHNQGSSLSIVWTMPEVTAAPLER